jgi:hypothetical protein
MRFFIAFSSYKISMVRDCPQTLKGKIDITSVHVWRIGCRYSFFGMSLNFSHKMYKSLIAISIVSGLSLIVLGIYFGYQGIYVL